MNLILVLPGILLLLTMVSAYNYCNNNSHVCNANNQRHFMCELAYLKPYMNTAKYLSTFPDIPPFRSLVLSTLNFFRNSLASGSLKNAKNVSFVSAKRMRELIWDRELGYLSRRHAETVSFQHTRCRATRRFPKAGEVVCMIGATSKRITLSEIVDSSLRQIFLEHKQVRDPTSLTKAFNPVRDHAVAHFTVFISDRVSRVGCGIATGSNCSHGEQTGICHFLTCMFDYNNIAGDYVYKTGLPATDCMAWGTHRSGKYSSLCDNNGDIMFETDHFGENL